MQTKVEAISAKIAALQTLQSELQAILNFWQEQPLADRLNQTICPNIQAIAE